MPQALTRTYVTDVDYPLSTASAQTQQRHLLWCIKASLKKEILAANSGSVTAWTCVGSSDGVTGAMDGVDRWGSTFDATKVIRAASGTAHSWIVLYNAGLGLYFAIDYIGTLDYHAAFGFMTTAPTGGTNLVRATSTTEAYQGTGTIFAEASVFTAANFHRVFDSTGLFHCVVTRTGQTRVATFIGLAVLADLVYAGDAAPWVLIADYYSGSSGIALRGNSGAWSGTTHCRARNPLNAAALNVGPLIYGMPTSGTSDWLGGSSTHMIAADAFTGKWLEFPTWIGGQSYMKGRLADWWQCSEAILNLSIYPASPPAQTHLFSGTTWFPFTATPTI